MPVGSGWGVRGESGAEQWSTGQAGSAGWAGIGCMHRLWLGRGAVGGPLQAGQPPISARVLCPPDEVVWWKDTLHLWLQGDLQRRWSLQHRSILQHHWRLPGGKTPHRPVPPFARGKKFRRLRAAQPRPASDSGIMKRKTAGRPRTVGVTLSWSRRDRRDLCCEALRRKPQVLQPGADQRATMRERQLDAHL